MGNSLFHLKYRPFQLSDIAGQQFTVNTFKQASSKNKFAHSYLFSGNKGCGKTSTARILSNLMTCENVKDGVLCGECRACKTIRHGMSSDVIELDGAQKRKVEDIQALIESSKWPPQELKKKIFIIDECHCLSSTAISALLKIVEEPPEFLAFIFCTTEQDKIPDTILSRSQLFNFKKISKSDIFKKLKFIAEQEKIEITDDALYSIAKLGNGSLRDSIVRLEQIYTILSNKKITESHVEKYYGMIHRSGLHNIINSIVENNVVKLLDQCNDLTMSSANIKEILFEISEVFRNSMVYKASNGKIKNDNISTGEQETIEKICEKITLSKLDSLAKVFMNINKELEYNINERWILESTLIKCAHYINK
jgi:DNA polymerase-3 subunit gamma/tau